MRSTLYIIVALVLAGPCIALPPPSTSEVEHLVRQLGSDEFEQREAASKALEALGERALAALQKVQDAEDAETRSRARRLIEVIRRGRLLGATRDIRDEGKFFGEPTVTEAGKVIRAIRAQHAIDVLVETFRAPAPEAGYDPARKEQFFHAWVGERMKAENVHGVYVLVCRAPARIQIGVSTAVTKRAFPAADRDRLRDLVVARFREQRYDDGLLEGLRLIEQAVRTNLPDKPASVGK
jgi:TPM domain